MGGIGPPVGARHASWVFASDAEHQDVLTAYLLEGLEAGDRVAYLASPGSRAELALDYLDAAGIDVALARRDGRLEIGSADDAYIPGGRFDPDARLRTYRSLATNALVAGFRAFRVAAEVPSRIELNTERVTWAGYELRADLLATSVPFRALCCYDGRRWDPRVLQTINGVHSSVIIGDDGLDLGAFRLHATTDGSLAIEGEVDYSDADAVRSILAPAVADLRRPVIDVSELSFVDAAGMRTILAVLRKMREAHGRAEIRGASPMFRKVWSILGFEDVTLTPEGSAR